MAKAKAGRKAHKRKAAGNKKYKSGHSPAEQQKFWAKAADAMNQGTKFPAGATFAAKKARVATGASLHKKPGSK